MQVNNNGYVTFDISLREWTARAFPIVGSHRIIAPFWTDISTLKGGSLWYRTTTNLSILQKGTNEIRTVFPRFVTFSATWMMIVTWEEVAAYGCSDTSTGTITCQQVRYLILDAKMNQLINILFNVLSIKLMFKPRKRL